LSNATSKNLKGRLLDFVLRTIGKGLLERAFVIAVKASKPGTARRKRNAPHEEAVISGGSIHAWSLMRSSTE
jgi:hypothetical protein